MNFFLRFPILLFLILIVSFSSASAAIDFEKIEIEELDKMSEDELNKLPFIPLFARLLFSSEDVSYKLAKKRAVLMMEVMLSELKFYPNVYPSGEMSNSLIESVKKFQRQNEFDETGILTFGEFEILGEQLSETNPKKLISSAKYSLNNFKSDGLANATGAWVMKDDKGHMAWEKMAWPINTVEINCILSIGICIESEGYALDSLSDTTAVRVKTTFYEILKWDNKEIIAQNSRNINLFMNFATNQVLKIYRRNEHYDYLEEFLDTKIPGSTFELVSSDEIDNGYNNKNYNKRSSYTNKEFVDEFLNKASS